MSPLHIYIYNYDIGVLFKFSINEFNNIKNKTGSWILPHL